MKLLESKVRKISAQLIYYAQRVLQSSLGRRSRPNHPTHAHLIIAPLFMGDLFMLAPFIQGLRAKNPNDKLVLLCSPGPAELGDLFPIDQVIPANSPNLDARNSIYATSPQGYDTCYVIFAGAWLRTLATLPIKKVVSFPDPKGRCTHLIDEMVAFPSILTPLPEITLKLLQCPYPNIPPLDRWTPKPGNAVLHMGARNAARQLTLMQTIQLITALMDRGISTIRLTGDSSEIISLDQIKMNLPPHNIHLIDLRTKTTLKDISEILSESEILVVVDTGIAHLAKAIGTPTLVLLGQSQTTLFGMDNNFSRSRHFAVNDLHCRKKKTLHGLKADWIMTCNAKICPLETRYCLPDLLPIGFYKQLDTLLEETKSEPR